MNPDRFDTVSRLFAQRRLTRRNALAGAGLAIGAAAVTGLSTAAAQDATPAATPEVVSSPDLDQPPGQLFVQSFQSGSIAANADGTHTVTLERGLGQTIVFTDRPSREVFTTPTTAFLDGLGFNPDNPPNAAMVMDLGDGETDIAVVELFNPTYDDATHTATYDITVLANWENELDLGFHEAPTDLSGLTTSFGATHLFIDDCPSVDVLCLIRMDFVGYAAQGDAGQLMCYSQSLKECVLCTPWNETGNDRVLFWIDECNRTVSACNGRCNNIDFS